MFLTSPSKSGVPTTITDRPIRIEYITCLILAYFVMMCKIPNPQAKLSASGELLSALGVKRVDSCSGESKSTGIRFSMFCHFLWIVLTQRSSLFQEQSLCFQPPFHSLPLFHTPADLHFQQSMCVAYLSCLQSLHH